MTSAPRLRCVCCGRCRQQPHRALCRRCDEQRPEEMYLHPPRSSAFMQRRAERLAHYRERASARQSLFVTTTQED